MKKKEKKGQKGQKKEKQPVLLFTDGASSGNPGPSGWGLVMVGAHHVEEKGGRFSGARTNQYAELYAAIQALESIEQWIQNHDNRLFHILTDSKYVFHGVTRWIESWEKRGWKTITGGRVKNQFFWKQIQKKKEILSTKVQIVWKWVKAHEGHFGNERADQIARCFSKRESISLYQGARALYLKACGFKKQTTPFYKKKKQYVTQNTTQNFSKPWYVSFVNGVLRRDLYWEECKKHVLGKKNALFKKVKHKQQEQEVLARWGVCERRVARKGKQ